MTLSELLSKLTRDHPDANQFTTAQQTSELNEGQLEISYVTDCLPTEGDFNIAANTETYALSSIDSNFLKIDREGGLQIKTISSNTKFDRMNYRTMEELDSLYAGWRNDSAGTPHSYFQRGANIHIYPKMSAAVTSGGRLYLFEKPDVMVASTSKPFNELSQYEPFHKLVVLYAAEVLLTSIKRYQEASAVHSLYIDRLAEMMKFIKGDQIDDYSPDVLMGINSWRSPGRRAGRF